MRLSSSGIRGTVRAGLQLLACIVPLAVATRAATNDIVLKQGVALALGGRMGRTPFRVDPVEARIVRGEWTLPAAGDSLPGPGGTNRVWEAVTAGEDGTFQHRAVRGGYFSVPFVSDSDRILLLRAAGHSMAYVNGEPRAGDIYRNGSVSLPVAIRKGTNDLLFATGRGPLSVVLSEPEKPVAIDHRDTTFPDLVLGQANDTHGAVILVNATRQPLDGLTLVSELPGGSRTETAVPRIPALGTHKAAFRIRHSGSARTNTVPLTLHLRQGRTQLDTTRFTLPLRRPEETRRETFVSGIDGSVQYFSFVPARPVAGDTTPAGVVLSAHGASVEAQGQAACYTPKARLHVAAPTNRRPFGFDWEDWGRRDAIEVLDLVQSKYRTDRSRTYLTGHSMGGHGTWQMGATLPDRFAALAPSAGWISFATYAGGRRAEPTNDIQRLLFRAWNTSDTLGLVTNYLHHGIYILHGDADDNVPVGQARTMRSVLEGFHKDFDWHEQPGAGHWWGNACVDWPPMFELFARRRIPHPSEVRHIRFATANPGASAASHWVTIEAQQRALDFSRVDLRWDAAARRFSGTTENVARLVLNPPGLDDGRPVHVELDGQTLSNPPVRTKPALLRLARVQGVWQPAPAAPAAHKGPHRAGPFKEAFGHRMLFVYATRGTAEENAWAYAKARFDSESFWYRGNASIELVPDTAFNPSRDRDRGVIVYGNADNNAAWKALLGDSPVQVTRDAVRIGDRTLAGTDLACLFVRPRPGSDIASVGVVSGTGPVGLRLNDRVPYFMAGVAYPDVTVFGPESLDIGAGGARATGFFGNDWSVESGEIAFRP